ncbi:hypothetical protein H8356DRAFT_982675 [Neocallimastix lanati (nom. inval.)]|jgi:hypothetical protein|uniref:RGS domain-containing protein n=1 Tax=Neocallimastix californiae TaxID=1754190 RepID=A0A1Y2DB89_9FUNG|nr:hypothetical protein H8356DRAFT_982675 [Neocallimastix sp. JGI-2020a]ORY56467.1 hypothetical protein LY90DRAFT_701777 [Neocallimastix californiae]|eukprot:ORY56467.1 hypothetical protein LY90DRAFT_701777 [Neocallimastix californiae]
MLEKRTIFNTTVVNDAEFEEYKNRGFITEKGFVFEKLLFKVLFVIFIVFFGVSLFLFFKLRKSYIIRQRGFTLSFIGGIVTFINVFISFLPQLMKVPCALSAYSANFLNVLVNLIFFCRSLRVILFYRYNIFKVTSVKKRRVVIGRKGKAIKEPNNYLAKISKKIYHIIAAVIIIPACISLIATIILHITMKTDSCSFTQFDDAMLDLKRNKGRRLFFIVQVSGGIYMLLSFIMTILLSFVKDTNVFGVKFECLSTCILILLSNIINIILQVNASIDYDVNTNNHRRMYLDLFEITKGGKMLFSIVSIYMLFTSITLPLIHYYKAKRNAKRYASEDLNTKSFFNKVLNNPSLVNELRNIAIKEFSAENVLFWENYQVLQKMNYRYYVEYKKAEEMGDPRLIDQYDFEGYYQEQIQSYTTSAMDNYSYDQNVAVPETLLPYYNRFYKTFIDENGNASVNLSELTYKQIQSEISLPTVGIFDVAKDEVVDLMYNSIYPILLSKNEKYIKKTLC